MKYTEMRRRLSTLGCLSAALVHGVATFAAGPASGQGIGLRSLLAEMTDRTATARWPAPAYTLKQASSYDRLATNPAVAATWFANNSWPECRTCATSGAAGAPMPTSSSRAASTGKRYFFAIDCVALQPPTP